jgi:predicted oxidoreductase (fatty acid repression mutant protein)
VTAHAYVFLANGFVFGGALDSKNGFVALEALTLDTQAPSPPIINPVTADNTINAAEVGTQITGQNETGATVALTIAGIVRAATVIGSNWSYTLTAADITAMNEGAETLSATQTDPALNVSLAATREIKVDTIAPTAANTSGFYTSATNTLVLTGSNYQTMWESGEGNTTDIKARLDWSKLFWDINADDAATPNVTFNLADIISAKVTQAGELTVILTNAKGKALEATRYYGGTAIDTLDILAGFDRDTAGNPAATDAKANAPLTISAFVPGDLVIDLGANGQLIKPVNLAGNNWIYYWDKNGDGSSQSASLFNNASDTISHTTLNGIFNKSSTGSTGIGTDDTYRFTTLNGVNVALPTAGQYPNSLPLDWADSLTYWSATPSFNGSFQSVNPASGGATPFVGSSTLYVALQVLPTTVTINDVAEDDTINISEQNTTLTGLNASGASVALSIGGNTRAATVNGTNWSYTLTQADINAMGQGPETLSATQTVAGVTGTPVTHDITVDTISPIATHTSAAYTSQSNTLVITGSNYQSLWVFAGENNTTDIKARLDWSKLSWDTNSDNSDTANVSFALADIASAKVSSADQLTVVLTDIKGAALEATSRYGGATADALDIAAGFSKDKAGNASTTEAKADLSLSVSAFVAGDKVIDLDSFGQLILPKQVDGGKYYYYWDRSASTSIANTGLLNGGVDYVTHDVLDGIFKQDINGNLESNSNAVGAVGETDDIFRYASLNGVPLALPTSGGGLTGIYAKTGSPTETAVGSDPASDGSNADNARFNDLLAIWDAYNGTRTLAVSASSGLPPGWENAYYWSATPSLQTDQAGNNTQGHALVQLSQNVVEGSFPDTNPNYVVLQVFPGAVSAAVMPLAPTIDFVATDNIISANEQLTTITGTNEAGATVNLMFSSGFIVNNVPVMINREAVVTDTRWSYTLVESDIVAMGVGDETLKANQTNASGNTSDAVSRVITIGPTVVNTSAAYTSAINTLVLTGTGYDILRGSDPLGTDIKAKLDWSKLKWDINGDDSSTADVSFVLGDIVSATATDNTHLTVVLTAAKGALLEATRFYGGTALNNIDTLDIAAGFAKDFAGTLRPTDAKSNATLSVSAFVAGDAVIDLGLGGQLIKPWQVDGGKFYYFWDRSGDGIANLADATSHNALDINFTLNINGALESAANAVGTVGETDNTFRFADVLGVKVALPTLGAAADATGAQIGTAVGSVVASDGSNAINPTYDDLMAIWDAYNGQGLLGNVAGVPPGWMAGDYASATPAGLLHASLNLSTGTVINDNPEASTNLFVALQVL